MENVKIGDIVEIKGFKTNMKNEFIVILDNKDDTYKLESIEGRVEDRPSYTILKIERKRFKLLSNNNKT